MRLLIVDDDDDVRFVTAQLLELDGWSVTAAATGTEALDLLAAGAFDVAVVDHNLPDLTGLEVARMLRGRGDTTPVLLWTGFAMALEGIDLTGLGVDLLEKADVSGLRCALARAVAPEGPGEG